jgi:hypothetical protein
MLYKIREKNKSENAMRICPNVTTGQNYAKTTMNSDVPATYEIRLRNRWA